MSRFLTILEVSQKQKFIFSSNRLAGCIRNSNIVAYITGLPFIEEVVNDKTILSGDKNLVYSGGGHMILEFDDLEKSKEVVRRISLKVLKEFPEIELFVRTIEYDSNKTPGENVKDLTAALERKKSLREAVFKQGSFGIEAEKKDNPSYAGFEKHEEMPDGFIDTIKLGDLGGSRDESNFVAVVHIDGNAMGKRVEEISKLPEFSDWEAYKKGMRKFSEGIAEDFGDAYEEMKMVVEDNIAQGNLKDLSLKKEGNKIHFPVRKIISEGDDICFIAEGRLGIECARVFLEKLAQKKNSIDGKPYASCAGIALVHQKYPFYRAYELAEELCSNAKKFGAQLAGDGTGSNISSIDWHIEYGEFRDNLEETRRQYDCDDGKRMELRPYIVKAPEDVLAAEPARQYKNFRKLVSERIPNSGYGTGLLKEMRNVIKKGEEATRHYLKYHKCESIGRDLLYGIYKDMDINKIGTGENVKYENFVETKDGKKRSIAFDAIEALNVFLPLKED